MSAEMDPREQELLKYLEDLQANNPAEYELLVKDLQEKQAAKQGAAGGGGSGEQVTPTPGFVAKTRSATRQGAKVFINVCSSEHVDKPAPVPAAADAEEVQMRIPLSLGPPREDLDKAGDVCTVYDVVFHPDAVEAALKEDEFRSFIMQLTVHQIMQKNKDEVSLEMSYPKMAGNYKGIAPLPQMMRKKGVPPPPPPGSEPEASAADDAADGKKVGGAGEKAPLVSEVAPAPDETLPAPCYSVESRPSGVPASEAKQLSVKVHLPQVEDASAIELGLNDEELSLRVPGTCVLALQLPQRVSLPPLSAKFEEKRRVLSLLLRLDVATSLDGTLDEVATGTPAPAAADETAKEEQQREALQNARRQRKAGEAQLAKQRQAAVAKQQPPSAEASSSPAAVDAATGSGSGEGADDADAPASAPPTDVDGVADEGETTPAASAGKPAASKEPPIGAIGVLELTNPIMFEIEDS